MKSELRIVMRNPQPEREPNYPHRWVIHDASGSFSLTVEHDSKNKPHVVARTFGEAA